VKILKSQGQNYSFIILKFFLNKNKIKRCIFLIFVLQTVDYLLQLCRETSAKSWH